MSFNFEIESINKEDIIELTQVMTRAFDDDAQKHFGLERGGPDGYDTGEFFEKWLFSYDECEGYKIVVKKKIIGAILVWITKDHNNTWGNVFIDPEWQNKGVCKQAWRIVESHYPETISWTLETPGKSTKNHKVYESLGFCKVREVDTPNHSGKSIIYRKTMHQDE